MVGVLTLPPGSGHYVPPTEATDGWIELGAGALRGPAGPRRPRGRLHRLGDLLTIAVCAVVCGADGWVEVEQFARAKEPWLRTFLALPRGVPAHDTFGRVFAALDPDAFEQRFVAWTAALAGATADGRLVAVDGKAVRRGFRRAWDRAAGRSVHLVSAFAAADGAVFAQVATDAESNGITAIPKPLDLLDLRGAVVTIDAVGCQRQVAAKIVAAGGDYVLAVKEDQPALHAKVKTLLDAAALDGFAGTSHGFRQTADGGHGRVEVRRAWVTDEVRWLGADLLAPWPGLAGGSVGMVESVRQDLGDLTGRVSTERRYFIGGVAGTDAERLAAAVRGHWSVENRLHGSLDVSFREDDCRVRAGHAAENFSRLRRVAPNLLRGEATAKVGIKAKRLKAGWDHDYLLKTLTG